MISEVEIVIRLLVAAVLGAAVGFERERDNQPAGLRTHMILVIGATLAMCLSINMSYQFKPDGIGGDPARLAAQVISGIGFLGAGAILRYGFNVKGLTTATSLWSMAVVGLAIGLGYYLIGIATTVIMIVILVLLGLLERKWIRRRVTRVITVQAEYEGNVAKAIRKAINKHVKGVDSFNLRKNIKSRRVQIQAVARVPQNDNLEDLSEIIADIQGVRSVKIE